MSRQAQFESGVPLRSVLTQSPELPLHPGDEVDGRYIVDAIIGTGGVGIVVSAHHKKRVDERVAIKFLQSTAMTSDENVLRFEREARAAARIRSEHVSSVIDFGVLASGAPYMVLEYLEGSDLAQAMATSGPLPYSVAVDTIVQVCEGVVHAHAAGVVHRDLKPANLFLTKRPDGTPIVKVLDFGISKLTSDEEVTLTQATSVIGSPMYMSPEQIVSPRDADRQSDLWSLGVILYELIAGRPPFSGKSMGGLCAAICQGQVDPLGVEVPPALEALLMRCLKTDRKQRVGSAVELAEALAPFGTQESARMVAHIQRLAEQNGMRPSPTVAGNGAVAPHPTPGPMTISVAMHGAGIADPISMGDGHDETPSGARPVSFPPQPRVVSPRPGRNRIALGALVAATMFGLVGAGAYGLHARFNAGTVPWGRRAPVSVLRGAAVAPTVLGAADAAVKQTAGAPPAESPPAESPPAESPPEVLPEGVAHEELPPVAPVEVGAAVEVGAGVETPHDTAPQRRERPRTRNNGKATPKTPVTGSAPSTNPLDVLSER